MSTTPTQYNDGFDKPTVVSPLTLAFPAELGNLIPPWKSIPEDFRHWAGRGEARQWVKFQEDWFFNDNLDVNGLVAHEGIGKIAALRHLAVIQKSFEPKHEHKQAAVAWLASRWFTAVPA